MSTAPAFFQNKVGNTEMPWQMSNSVAFKPVLQTSAVGWFPLQLPDSNLIKSLTVFG
jgi:hypothetical protein